MYTQRFSLPVLAEVLIASAERRRPGLGPWTPQAREAIEAGFLAELSEMRSRYFELFDDKDYWEKVEKNLREVCLPRYCVAAQKQTGLEQHDYEVWRGGDLVARAVYAVLGLLLGLFLVKTPWIPIPPTWDALILLLMIAAPFLPDAQISLKQRSFRQQLRGIVSDMAEAESQQNLYQPLSAGKSAEQLEPISPITSDPSDRSAVPQAPVRAHDAGKMKPEE